MLILSLLFVATQQPQTLPGPETPGLLIPAGPAKQIIIDIKEQTLVALEYGAEKFNFKCSTGKNNGTPRGEYPVREKLRYNRALSEYGGAPIPFTLRLDVVTNGKRRRIAIHAHSSVPSYPASRGCIRLRHADAEHLFKWAEVGMKVTIK